MKKISLFLFVLMSSFDTFSLLPIESYVPKGLLIFLDDSEKNLGAISQDLVIALSQKAGPIIASMSLLANVLHTKFKYEALIAAQFNSNQWLIKKVNESLCVLLPHDFLTDQRISIQDVQKVDFKQVSDVELQLGLKVNHMEPITIDNLVRGKHEYATYFLDALNTLFCTRIDYLDRSVKQPLWSIYAIGHGTMGQRVIWMKLSEFKKVLDFFEQKINCRLFIYTSCYAAGLNNELIYKDALSAIQRAYSFAIITQAITDAAVVGAYFEILDINGQTEIKTDKKLNSFLANAQSETLNYQEIAKNLFPLIPEVKYGFGNVPQIKLPGLEWFSVLASHEDIVSIGSILAKTFNSKKKLNIVRYFKTDPKVILLSASILPFELVINGNNLQAIISTIPGDSFQTIQKISSNHEIDTILDWFMPIKMLNVQKFFFIKQINEDITDVVIANTFEKDRHPYPYERHAYYKSGKKLYARRRNIFQKFETFEAEFDEAHEEYQSFIKLFEKLPQQEVQPVLPDDIEKIKELFKDKEREAARRKIEESREKMLKEALAKDIDYQDIIRKAQEQFGIKAGNFTQLLDSLKVLEKSIAELKEKIGSKKI